MPTDFAPVSAPAAATPLFAGAALLDAEKLDGYRLAVESQGLAARVLPKRGTFSLRDPSRRPVQDGGVAFEPVNGGQLLVSRGLGMSGLTLRVFAPSAVREYNVLTVVNE